MVPRMNADETARAAAGRLLAWYEAMGVDAALADAPIDWMARANVPPGAQFSLQSEVSSPVATPAPQQRAQPGAAPAAPRAYAPQAPIAKPARQFPARPAAAPGGEANVDLARAGNLAALGFMLAAFDGCGLKATAKNLCFYRGAERAPLMIVGEAPGREEDLEGKPFVGRAGQLLDRMLAAIGLDRTKVYIANMVPWRPPGNRNPTPDELAQCAPFIHRQIELVAPKLLVTLGNVPTQALFETNQGITRMRGQWKTLSINSLSVPTLPTLHPAFLLRTPGAKAQAWKDMLSLKQAIVKERIGTA